MKKALAAVLAWALLSLAHAQSPIVIKFSHVVAEGTPKGKAAAWFARRAAELTQGRVKVEVYPDSRLYKDQEELEALQLGTVQMLAPSLSKFGPLGIKEFEAFDLPFIFEDQAALRRVTQGPVGRKMLRKLEARGLVGLTFWDNGFKVFSSNRPIRDVADFKGQKMRIQASTVLDASMRALGAVPEVYAFSDAREALQTGMVDGTENPPSNLYTQKMHEVQKFVNLSYHGYLGYVVVVNKAFWDELPQGIRQQLSRAVREATQVGQEAAARDNEDALNRIRALGTVSIHTPTPSERLALKRALLPVHRQMAPRIGEATIQEIYQATGFTPGPTPSPSGTIRPPR